jgi:GNAT superfamily N-acetyltransferase
MMENRWIIRELIESDLDALLELCTHLHDADDPRPDAQTVRDVWQTICANPAFTYFGGFVEERLAASCTLTIIPNLTRGCRPYGLIENVVTHAEFRRQGYGRAVLRHALAWAWEHHCYKVMLLTGRKNETTYRFYESVGFDRNAKQAFLAKPDSMGT